MVLEWLDISLIGFMVMFSTRLCIMYLDFPSDITITGLHSYIYARIISVHFGLDYKETMATSLSSRRHGKLQEHRADIGVVLA